MARTRDEKERQRIERALSGMSPGNRETMTRYLRVRRVDGLKTCSLSNYAYMAANVDTFTEGTAFQDLSPDDVLDWVLAERGRIAESSVVLNVRLLKRLLRDLHGWETIPLDYRQVLRVREPQGTKRANVVEEDQLRAILDACKAVETNPWDSPRERLQAFVLTLWDTGLRVSEALSLKVQDVQFDDGGVRFSLDPASPKLKTGTRVVYAVRCSHALKVWLSLHPDGMNPDAPVFTSSRRQSPPKAMTPQLAGRMLRRLSELAGVRLSGTKPLSPHDLRHTAATMRARQGWMEAELRAYFGWKKNSKMPAHYVHLAKGDMRERVRRDAGVDDHGFKTQIDAGGDAQVLAALLQRILAQGGERRGHGTGVSGGLAAGGGGGEYY